MSGLLDSNANVLLSGFGNGAVHWPSSGGGRAASVASTFDATTRYEPGLLLPTASRVEHPEENDTVEAFPSLDDVPRGMGKGRVMNKGQQPLLRLGIGRSWRKVDHYRG